MNKIAILIPTILKDDNLMKVINSILDNWQDDWVILIGDQNKPEDYSKEKKMFYNTVVTPVCMGNPFSLCVKVVQLPFDCGLSYARNKLVETAHELGIKYCVIAADSIKFTESMRHLHKTINVIKELNYDLIGFDLIGRIGWEATLDLKDSFVLNFIDKTKIPKHGFIEENCGIWDCDIVRNFFLATTESLLNVKWDNDLKMAEHNDFFWRYKQAGYKVGWTDYCEGAYISCDDPDYKKLRRINMMKGKELLKRKYNLTSWVKYIHLERTKIKGK